MKFQYCMSEHKGMFTCFGTTHKIVCDESVEIGLLLRKVGRNFMRQVNQTYVNSMLKLRCFHHYLGKSSTNCDSSSHYADYVKTQSTSHLISQRNHSRTEGVSVYVFVSDFVLRKCCL